MDEDDISYQDLLDDEPAGTLPAGCAPASFAQLLADGFPIHGGMAALNAIAQLPDPGQHLAIVQRGYQQILAKQRGRP